jgi:hypothetical protein
VLSLYSVRISSAPALPSSSSNEGLGETYLPMDLHIALIINIDLASCTLVLHALVLLQYRVPTLLGVFLCLFLGLDL